MVVDLAEWERFDRIYPAPTFFSKPAFARALRDAYPRLEPYPLSIVEGRRSYLVPLMRTSSNLGWRSGVGFPFGGYSCILDEDGRVADATVASAVLAQAARRFDSFEFIPWPLDEQPSLRGATAWPLTTAVIDCGDGAGTALSGMRGVTRRMAGQAARRGVECVLSGGTPADIERYYAILKEASAGWGLEKPTLPLQLLQAVFERGGEDAELWFATQGGEEIAGGVVLYGSRELFFWSAALRRERARLRPSNALNMRLIERAAERGKRWYNLGASDGLTGVERFKHDLGARTIPYHRLRRRGRAATMYHALRGAILSGAGRS